METDKNDTPKKYIRTLAGDLKTLQEGGQPELAPLEAEEVPATSEPALAPQSVPLPAPSTPEEPKNSPIETYESDFADRLKETGATPLTVLASEQDAEPVQTSAPTEAPKKLSLSGIWYAIGGTVLIVIAGGVAFFAYSRYAASVPQPLALAPNLSAPIAVDERVPVSGTGTTLMGTIVQSVGTPIGAGTIRLLYLSASTTGASVFSALQLPAPDILRRNANAAGSMAGVIVIDGTQSPFFILSVASYNDTFSGMLSWEPNLLKDLSALFPAYATAAATGTAGSRDEDVNNHDARVYRDAQGKSVLLYGYWNQTTLVIARDPAAFSTILMRLAASSGAGS